MKRLKDDLSKNVANLTYVSRFVSDYEKDAPSWDGDKILARARNMAADAYQKVWKIN